MNTDSDSDSNSDDASLYSKEGKKNSDSNSDDGSLYSQEGKLNKSEILANIVKVEPNDPNECHDNLYKFKIYCHDSIDIEDEYGRTVIQLAIQNNQNNIVEYIFEKFNKQIINDKDQLGFNILHYAGKYFIIFDLLLFYADKIIKIKKKHTQLKMILN